MSLSPILPGQWLGILGGGQLGRMFTHAAQAMGYRVCVLDPDAHSPAGMAADRHLCAAYLDESALRIFADLCASVSTEFENIPAQTLELLQGWGVFVAPNSRCIAIAQNRISEKHLLNLYADETGIDTAPYWVITEHAHLAQTPAHLFPGIIKTAHMGYDGKGQINVATHTDLARAWVALGQVPCVFEQRLPLAYEISAITVRGHDGAYAQYNLVENNHRSGILHASLLPAVSPNTLLAQKMCYAARCIAEKMEYVGVLCVEYFVLDNGHVVINEIAPRPHNSGHATIDACYTSQFEQQVRAMARLPLGNVHQFSPALMLNLLGDLWFPVDPTQPVTPDWEKILALPQAQLHLYGKHTPRVGRKMGHLNLLDSDTEHIKQAYRQACITLGIQP
ncbi:MAG: 5-(carboxyamino)imidazole ribonucleotide synthase [Ottowia sp.]|jgi:5-(carboxyamino)imidazole ribonucleotide synthase|nr:5-(carboxyamino)imidazole ribonucleotide synthase [Ottowia sp.]